MQIYLIEIFTYKFIRWINFIKCCFFEHQSGYKCCVERHKFYILAGNILKSNSGQHLPSGYNFAEVFIKNYLDILIEYSGLSKKDMSEEKFNLFNKMIIPWCRLIKAGKVNLSLDGIDQIFKNYYKNESYYKELLQSLNNIIH